MITRAEFEKKAALMQHGCIYEENIGIGVFRSAALAAKPGVKHGFTARGGGVSTGPFASLNLSFGKVDDPANVRENFLRLCRAENLVYGELAVVNFVHGNNVIAVDSAFCGRGFDKELLPPCDGFITNDPGITLVTDHADCGCIFAFDPVKRAVGIAHAGWKGTLGRIGGKLIALMQSEYGCDPQDIITSTGPCICRECYEVDEELAARFSREFDTDVCSYPGKPGKAQLDMETAAAIQLLDAGVRPQNITLMEKCTFEDEERLFSHRRQNGVTGDMAGFIKLT